MSTDSQDERRRRRSPDPLIALHYQLSTTRHEGGLDAVVVADGSGVVVAGAGSWAKCEELAAFAPLMLRGDLRADHVTVRDVDIDGDRVLLCAAQNRSYEPATDGARDAALQRAAHGISRILRAA